MKEYARVVSEDRTDMILKKIKKYVKSLDKPDNEVFKDNELLILSCFHKAMEIVENTKPNIV